MPTNPLPTSVTLLIVAVDLAMATLVYFGVTRLAARPGVLATPTAGGNSPPFAALALTQVRRRTAALVVAWAAAAGIVTFALPEPPPVAIIAYVVAVVAAGYGLATRTETGRRLLAATPQHWLIGAQLYRTIGAVFLVAAASGVVPAYFAIPAGWGDILTGAGAGAVLVAAAWARRRAFARRAAWGWNLFGLADLVVAIGIGTSALARPAAALFGGSPEWLARAAAGFQPFGPAIFPVSFPLALIPTFVVPLGVVLHLLSLRKLWLERGRAGSTAERTAGAEPAGPTSRLTPSAPSVG